MKLLIGNWKMAPESMAQAQLLAKATLAIARAHKKSLTVIACPPFVYIEAMARAAKTLVIAAQNVSDTTSVASTGHISAGMLKNSKVGYCIVGHSESRADGETDQEIKEKIDRLLEKKIQPILCVGEKTRDTQGWYLSVIKDQIEIALRDIPTASLKRLIIAYEPVWAIGASALRGATPNECREMIIFIRKLISDLSDEKTARAIPILYGGSVTEDNAASFVSDGEAAGLLVGRVSLAPKQFGQLAKNISLL